MTSGAMPAAAMQQAFCVETTMSVLRGVIGSAKNRGVKAPSYQVSSTVNVGFLFPELYKSLPSNCNNTPFQPG